MAHMNMSNRKTKLIIESRYENYLNSSEKNKLDKKEYYRMHILNEKNQLITLDILNNILKKYGYTCIETAMWSQTLLIQKI